MAQSHPLRPPAFLVVEDEALVRMDLVALIEHEGYKVYEASHADGAIQMMEAHPEITVLFTDIDMPGSMDGIKLSHYVKSRWPPVKIFVASERRTPSPRELPSGAMFISKPYGDLDLQRLLESV